MDKNQPASNSPVSVIRDGSIKATLWSNQSEKGVYVSTTFAKTYEDKDGKLKDSQSFSGTDLLRISELARKAYSLSNRIRKEHGADQEQGSAEPKPTQPQRKAKIVEYSL